MAEARIAPRPKRGFIVNDDFSEQDHPRAENGQFGSGGGSSSGATVYKSGGAFTKEPAGEHVDTDEDISATGHDGKDVTYDLAYHHDGDTVRGHIHNVRNSEGTDAFEGLDRVQAYKLSKTLSAHAEPHVVSQAAHETEQSRQDHMTPEQHEAEVAAHQAAAAQAEAAKMSTIGGAVETLLARGWTPEQGKYHQQPELKGFASPSSQRQIKEMLRAKGHAVDEALEMAADRAAVVMLKREPRLALDRNAISVRTSDDDGHMHVTRTPISKANVCPYYGREVPGAEELGLAPDRIYKLYRDPKELAAAADSFNGKPLLFGHHAINAFNHDHDKVVGSVTGVEWDAPYLYARLDIWPSEATRAIDSGEHEQLSCAYRYRAIMEPGTAPDGTRYDGRMTEISGSHVALVPEGRAGPDVLVHDQAITHRPKLKDIFSMKPKTAVPSRTAASAQGAFTGGLASGIIASLRPKLAADAKLDVLPMLKGITAKNVRTKSPTLVRALDAALKGKLAKDAEMDADEVKDIVEQVAEVMSENAEAIAAEVSPDVDVGADEDDADLRALLKAKGYSDEEIDAICKKEAVAASAAATDAEKAKEDAVKGMDAKIASAVRDAKKGMVEQTAMDSAISAAVDGAVSAERQRNRDIREAEAHVAASPVGKLAGAFDSAPDVYRAGLSALGVKDVDKLHESALRPVFDAHAGVKVAQAAPAPRPGAMDSAAAENYATRFGANASRLKI